MSKEHQQSKPDGWHKVKLSDVLLRKPEYGANASSVEFDPDITYRYVRITDIDGNGSLIEERKVGIPKAAGEDYLLQESDIVLARSGATVGKSYIHRQSSEPCAFAGYLIRVRVNETLFSQRYLAQYLRSPLFWKWVGKTSRAGAQPNISAEEYSTLRVSSPVNRAEQESIALVLEKWDAAIEKTSALIAAKQKLKTGLMQRLLTGKVRFKEFEGLKWHKTELGEFLKPVSRPVPRPNAEYTAMGLRSHGKGTFLRTVDDPDTVMMDTLYEVREDDLIVNITFAWEGAIALVNKSDEGALVSHRFPTYTFKRDKAIPEYFRHVILTKRFIHQLGIISPGGAGRNRVMSKRDFLELVVNIPSVTEQKRIADVLNGMDKELRLLERRLEALKKQKIGLMQQLLTGKKRVKM